MKKAINIKQSFDNRSEFIPTLRLERGEDVQDLFDRLPTTVYQRAVVCIEKAMEDQKIGINTRVILFYLGDCDIVEVPRDGWGLALKNAERHFAEIEEYEECSKIVKLLNPIEDAINIQ